MNLETPSSLLEKCEKKLDACSVVHRPREKRMDALSRSKLHVLPCQVDIHEYMSLAGSLEDRSQAFVLKRVGWLAAWNPCRPDGYVELALDRREERQIAKVIPPPPEKCHMITLADDQVPSMVHTRFGFKRVEGAWVVWQISTSKVEITSDSQPVWTHTWVDSTIITIMTITIPQIAITIATITMKARSYQAKRVHDPTISSTFCVTFFTHLAIPAPPLKLLDVSPHVVSDRSWCIWQW